MISGENPDGEFRRRAIRPGCRVLIGHDEVVIRDERIDRARQPDFWRAGITGNGAHALQCWPHDCGEIVAGQQIWSHVGQLGNQVQDVAIRPQGGAGAPVRRAPARGAFCVVLCGTGRFKE